MVRMNFHKNARGYGCSMKLTTPPRNAPRIGSIHSRTAWGFMVIIAKDKNPDTKPATAQAKRRILSSSTGLGRKGQTNVSTQWR